MPDAAPEAAKRLEIRKYPNRRYYDTTRSQHVTLEQIHRLIREGYQVRVIDSKTGQDITPKILAQIIIELDSPKLGVFPVPMLHRLLQSNQELVNDFIQKYFNQPLTAYMDSQRNMEQYFRQAMGIKSAPSMQDWAKLMWGPFNPSFWTGDRGAAPAAEQPAPAPQRQNEQDLKEQVASLGRQVARLQAELTARGRRRSRAGARDK
jgi:polyhydroxyalkanoate synthesis repressor PhaR